MIFKKGVNLHHILAIFLCIICLVIGYSFGSFRKTTTQAAKDASKIRRLQISAVIDEEYDIREFTTEKLEGSQDTIGYVGLSDVTIQLDQTSLPLELALQSKQVSVAELSAWARIDAENHFCVASCRSRNGLTEFIYAYPEFDVNLAYDIYETPDGKQNLVQMFLLCYPGGAELNTHVYTDEDGHPLDSENWGIQLSIASVSPAGISLNYQQADGQQIGQLTLTNYEIFNVDAETVATSVVRAPLENLCIENDACGQLRIDWSKQYGKLSQGQYVIRICIEDIYERKQVHPLMKNFQDRQFFEIEFSIS